jgi:hypothetical protein
METRLGGGYLRNGESKELYIICGSRPEVMFRVPGIKAAQKKCKDISVEFKKGEFAIPEHLFPNGLERALLGKCQLEGCDLPAYLRVDYETLNIGDSSIGFSLFGCSVKHTEEYKRKQRENHGRYNMSHEQKRDIEGRPFIILKAKGE